MDCYNEDKPYESVCLSENIYQVPSLYDEPVLNTPVIYDLMNTN